MTGAGGPCSLDGQPLVPQCPCLCGARITAAAQHRRAEEKKWKGHGVLGKIKGDSAQKGHGRCPLLPCSLRVRGWCFADLMARLRGITNIYQTFMAFFKQFIHGSEGRTPKSDHLVQIPALGQQHWARYLTVPCLSFLVRKTVFLPYRVIVRIK